jgi:hypothetical protein
VRKLYSREGKPEPKLTTETQRHEDRVGQLEREALGNNADGASLLGTPVSPPDIKSELRNLLMGVDASPL